MSLEDGMINTISGHITQTLQSSKLDCLFVFKQLYFLSYFSQDKHKALGNFIDFAASAKKPFCAITVIRSLETRSKDKTASA